MTELATTVFDKESNIAMRAALQDGDKIIAARAMQSIDVAISGARLYLTCADMIGGHIKQATFQYDGKTVTIGVSVREADSNDSFTSNEVDRDAQQDLCLAVIDAFDRTVEDGTISGYEQGAMLVAGLVLLYKGLKDSDIKELRFRHSQKNYISNIRLSPEGNSNEKEGKTE